MTTPSSVRLSFCLSLLVVLPPGYNSQTPKPDYSPVQDVDSNNCGNSEFSSANGTITSPNYPGAYENYEFCNYFVTATALSTISFSFNFLSLEYSFPCIDDWIEFTCQSNSIRRTVRYCGQGAREELTFKPCTTVLVRFVANTIDFYTGFSVSYNIETISCQGNCTPVAIGAGYNCTCDSNQTDPFIAPPYDQCPYGCGLSSASPTGYCYCYTEFIPTTPSTTWHPSTPTVTCPEGCYSYVDKFGYPLCYCNVTMPSTSSTPPSTTSASIQCPFGCYIADDDYGYPICRCEGTTRTTPCPFGCYNVTYYYGYSYCDCSTMQSTTPLTITCPSECTPDTDFWGTAYCRCGSGFVITTTSTTTTQSPAAAGCNVTHYDDSGTVKSPGYPLHPYVSSTVDCVQYVTVPSASSIRLTFVTISLYCSWEFLQITGCDGSSTAQFCSSSDVTWPMEFICTKTYTVTIFLRSSYYGYIYSYTGFMINYEAFFGSNCSSGGGLVSLGGSGNIVSPNYPFSYPLSSDCYYVVQAAEEGQTMVRIQIAFVLVRMYDSPGCSLNFIKISCLDGSGAPWIVCGTRVPSPVTFNCSIVEIQFHSEIPQDTSLSQRSFELFYFGVAGLPSVSMATAVSLPSSTTVPGGEPGQGQRSSAKSVELSLILLLLLTVVVGSTADEVQLLSIFETRRP